MTQATAQTERTAAPPAGAGVVAGRVSVVLVNYNGLADLDVCLNSMLKQTHADVEIVLVDSASTDGSVDYVRAHFPGVRVIASDVNVGYSLGNALGIQAATGEHVIISNTDVEVAPDWIAQMLRVAQSDPRIKLVCPKILMFDERDVINAAGNVLQYMGFATCRGRGEPAARYSDLQDIAIPSGASFLVERTTLDEVGGFGQAAGQLEDGRRTTRYYYDDAHIAWRLRLAGYRAVLAPDAIVYHKYVVKPVTPSRYVDLEVTRLTFMLANLSGSSLWVLWPSLLLGEVIAFGFALLQNPRLLLAKLQSYGALWRGRDELRRMRASVRCLRRVPDSAVFRLMDYTLDFEHQMAVSGPMKIARALVNAMLRVTYELAYLSVRLSDALFWRGESAGQS